MPSDRDGLPTSAQTATSSAPDVIEDAAARLLTLLRELLLEIRQSERAVGRLSLDSHVDRDLALDSLARTELLQRVEKVFQVQLDERVLLVETPRDLLELIQQARGEPMTSIIVVEPRVAVVDRSTVNAPAQAVTLPEVLDWHSEAHPDRVAIQIYGAHDQIDHTFTYASLRQSARALATGLRARGLQPGQTVAIMLPTGSEYFLSFFGILLAGGIPVPIYPPVRPSQIEEHLRRHARLLNNAEAVTLITVPEAKLVARLLQAQVEHLRHVVTADELAQEPAAWSDAAIKTEDLAFLQYTSGSTGDPKGVMLTHANLLANLRAMGPRVGACSDDVFISWLPLYHDMGLIGACLGSLY
ncbi:MAG: AMP-binding protein, partial [Candidatus Competibacteraceae bacterium]|nr:AMP-binding protein [Candidatus Competibacteraceae bacterium]